MSRLEAADQIEAIVGATRHATDHIGRAISAKQRVYILHSAECAASGIDLRQCEYSHALDLGVDLHIWRDFEDRPVTLTIDAENGRLLPIITRDTPSHHQQPSAALGDPSANDDQRSPQLPDAVEASDAFHRSFTALAGVRLPGREPLMSTPETPRPAWCAGCGQPIGEFDFTEEIDGRVVHEGCTR